VIKLIEIINFLIWCNYPIDNHTYRTSKYQNQNPNRLHDWIFEIRLDYIHQSNNPKDEKSESKKGENYQNKTTRAHAPNK